MKKIVVTLALCALGLIGCDKDCHNTVQDFANITNYVGTDVAFSVCKGGYGESLIQLRPNSSGVVNLGSREEVPTNSQMGMGTCKSKTTQNYSIPLSLAPMSVGYVQLCYRQLDNTYVVTAAYQVCPGGFVPQVSSGPCPRQN